MRGMLSRLNIRNLALVDSLAVSFENGLNVITGETGAGKSLLIGALRLVLGERADKSLIRTGETTCNIEAVFELADPADVNAALDAVGLPPCEDGQLIIRRTITDRVKRGHIHLQETLADDVLRLMLAHPHVRAARVATEKPDVYPDCEGVGVEVFRIKGSPV